MRRLAILPVLLLSACGSAVPPAPIDLDRFSFSPTENSPSVTSFVVETVRGDQKRITGEVHNPDSVGYARASFQIQGRDAAGKLVEVDYLDVDGIAAGETREFEELFFARDASVEFTIEKHHAFRE